MQETLGYIEAYFQQLLNDDERKVFEERCQSDETFATEVAFYLAARQASREVLLHQKQKNWQEEEVPVRQITGDIEKPKKLAMFKWLPYAAAACVVLFMAMYFLFAPATPQKLASNYVSTELSQLSQQMDGSSDSIALGMDAYNNKQYNVALHLFEGVADNHPDNSYAKKYTGLSYLQMKNYDKALEEFKALAELKGLHSNEGDFLQAATLLLRNALGDKEQAKTLLQKVVDENEDKNDIAKKWLKEW